MPMPKLPPDVEPIAKDARSVWNTITDKSRTWIAVVVFGALCFAAGGWML